jgi:hypothetical protein
MASAYSILQRIKLLGLTLAALLTVTIGKAQLTPADSQFVQGIFTGLRYSDDSLAPGNWYLHSPITSVTDIQNHLDSVFPFNYTHFKGSYKRIQVNQEMEYESSLNSTFNYYYNSMQGAYFQFDPIMKLNFALDGISSETYFTYTPSVNSSDCKIAYLIIPGSNSNQTTEIIRGSGYHNLNGYTHNQLKNQGDVFILCKPLEDFRALCWNKKRLQTDDYYTPGPSLYVYATLRDRGTPYGLNYLIETFALIKKLKEKYDKVVVLGCSQGGFASLLTGLESQPDAAIICSGYSVQFDNVSENQQSLVNLFGLNFVTTYTNFYVTQLIRTRLNTQFYFGYPDQENTVYQAEHDTKITETNFGSLEHVHYLYNYNYHSFPPDSVLQLPLQANTTRPTVELRVEKNYNGQQGIRFSICPATHFSGTLYLNNKAYAHLAMQPDSLLLLPLPEGVYTLPLFSVSNPTYTCLDTATIAYGLDHIPTDATTYPNDPSQNHLNFEFIVEESKMEYGDIKVFSVDGQTLLSKTNYDLHSRLDISYLKPGLYIVQVQLPFKRYSWKILRME